MAGKLWVVSIPIGDVLDISSRAIRVLRDCDVILCEDLRPAHRLLHELQLSNTLPMKLLIPLNEHTELKAAEEALALLRLGKNLALISDAGTPLIADPGQRLVRLAIEESIEVSPVPGASSVLAALVVSGFRSDTFYFAGFLPRDKSERKQAAIKLAARQETIVLLEAPYRLAQLLDDLLAGFGPNRNACVAMELSMHKERVARGTLLSLRDSFKAHPFKGEFVVVLEGRLSDAPKPKREKPKLEIH
jgi:16S rRNA (cytidine1402-2'-O)-methyltransferase